MYKNIELKAFPSFHYRPGYGFGLHHSIHGIEFGEHLKRHILNREDSEAALRVKHVLVIGSKTPWIEAILLENGVEKITSLVANPALTRSEHENITVISASDLSNMWSDGKVCSHFLNSFYRIIYMNYLSIYIFSMIMSLLQFSSTTRRINLMLS